MGTVLSQRAIKAARAEHRCALCSRTIAIGEPYRCTRIIGDDGPYTYKECAHCTALIGSACPPSLRDPLDDAMYHGEGYCDEDILQWEPETQAERTLKHQFERRWTDLDGTLYPVPTRDGLLDGEAQ